MRISVVNLTQGKISDATLQAAVRAVNRQIDEDFAPVWGMPAELRLEGWSKKPFDRKSHADLRGDAILYVWDKIDVEDALGYHDKTNSGIAFGIVLYQMSKELDEPWTVTLSHEALELIADPQANLLVQGPHPDPKRNGDVVFHWYEVCDAVQAETYKVDGVPVSNFVLPLYYTSNEEFVGRNDFLGTIHGRGKSLMSFGVNPGGYVGFFDPLTQEHETYERSRDAKAKRRRDIKDKARYGRRVLRSFASEQLEATLKVRDGKKAPLRK